MIRKVIQILKKHLDDAYREQEEMDEILVHDPFDILARYPPHDELRLCAREIVEEIRGIGSRKLLLSPKYKETYKFVQDSMLPHDADPLFVKDATIQLLRWLNDPIRKRYILITVPQ